MVTYYSYFGSLFVGVKFDPKIHNKSSNHQTTAQTIRSARFFHASCRQLLLVLHSTMKITVSTTVAADMSQVWKAYATPADICQWNAASEDLAYNGCLE